MAKLEEFKTLNEVELATVEGGIGPVAKIVITIGGILYHAAVENATEDCRKHFNPRRCVGKP